MRRPRFRLRTLMIVVAAIAVAMGYKLRADRLRERAKYHRLQELVHETLLYDGGCSFGVDDWEALQVIERTPCGADVRPASPEAALILEARALQRPAKLERYRKLAADHAGRARDLEHSALRPWLPVSNDLPPPEPLPPPDRRILHGRDAKGSAGNTRSSMEATTERNSG
jgi:hypothetical protein